MKCNLVGRSLIAASLFTVAASALAQLSDAGSLGNGHSRPTAPYNWPPQLSRIINASGQVIGQSGLASEGSASERHAFLFSTSGMLDISYPGAFSSNAESLNDAGQVAGYARIPVGDDFQTVATLFSNGQTQLLPSPDGFTTCYAYLINSQGDVLVRGQGDSRFGWSNLTYLYHAGSMNLMQILGGGDSYGHDLNNQGQAVGEAADPNGYTHAFLYSSGVTTDLGALRSDANSAAYSINALGHIAGSSESGPWWSTHAFLYRNGQMQDLGDLGGDYSTALKVNVADQVVGESTNLDGYTQAFLWDPSTGMTQIGPDGSVGSFATDLNSKGQVVGNAFDDNGGMHAFFYDRQTGQLRMVSLGGDTSFLFQLNDCGQAAGYAQLPGSDEYHAIRYDFASDTIADLGTFAGGTASQAWFINASGQVAGMSASSEFTRAFVSAPAISAPEARPDVFTTDEDTPLSIDAAHGLLANDSPAGGITAELMTQPSHGTLHLNPNGSLSYAPDLNYNGSDSFTYRARSGSAASAEVTVTLTINSVNDLPTATAGANQTLEATGPTTLVTLSGAGSDVEGPVTYKWVIGGKVVGTSAICQTSLPLGKFTAVLKVTDTDGATTCDKLVLTIKDTTPPVLSGVPTQLEAVATSTGGAVVSFSGISASDLVDQSVDLSFSPASGSQLPLGKTTVTVTAKDDSGNQTTATFTVQVSYSWSGLLQPVSNKDSSKAGSTVPVKFKLTGASAGIANASATLSVNGAGAESFKYSSTDDTYSCNWSTKGLKAGSYVLRVDLGDGVVRETTVNLR